MVIYSLDDKKIDENFKALEYLRSTGMFTEEELQELYDKQVEADREDEDENGC